MRFGIAFVIIVPMLMFAQERRSPIPKVGWDSLRSSIQYPNLLRRAGLRTALIAKINVDSTGILTNISFDTFTGRSNINHIDYHCTLTPSDSMFCEVIEKVCRSIQWNPGTIEGKRKSMEVSIPFIFICYTSDNPLSEPRIILEEDIRPEIQKIIIH